MMNCPSCGTIMVWLNGSVLHDPPMKFYNCRICGIRVVKYADGSFDSTPFERVEQQEKNIILLANLHVKSFCEDYTNNEYIQHCIELTGKSAHYFDSMINYIKEHGNKIGTQLLELIKNNQDFFCGSLVDGCLGTKA